MIKMIHMGKIAGLVGWVILAVLLLFGSVFYGLMGSAITEKHGFNCTTQVGMMCFRWSENETFNRPFEMMADSMEVTTTKID